MFCGSIKEIYRIWEKPEHLWKRLGGRRSKESETFMSLLWNGRTEYVTFAGERGRQDFPADRYRESSYCMSIS